MGRMISTIIRDLNKNQADLAFSVSLPAKSSMSTCWTKVNHSLFFSLSLSFLFLVTLTLTFLGRFLTPDDQMNWLSLVSILTSSVLIILLTSFLISEMALGAFLLNWILCVSLWMLTVVSKAVSVRAFLSTCLPIVVKQQLNIANIKYQNTNNGTCLGRIQRVASQYFKTLLIDVVIAVTRYLTPNHGFPLFSNNPVSFLEYCLQQNIQISYNKLLQKHLMFQPQSNQQYYQNQPKPHYVPNMPYPPYNPYQPNTNQQTQMQQNPMDNQKNYQNQMGMMNPNTQMGMQPQMQPQMQPPYQLIHQQYPNNQINIPKQATIQQFNKLLPNTNNDFLQQQRNYKDPNIPMGIPGPYQIPQQPFVPNNPNIVQNQGVYNPNMGVQLPPSPQIKQLPVQEQLKTVDQNNGFRGSAKDQPASSNNVEPIKPETKVEQPTQLIVHQPVIPSVVDHLYQPSDVASDDYFQYILMFGYRSKKGYQITNPSKVNQDSIVISTKLNQETSSHYFGICDGHGSDGHHVSGFLKDNFPALLNQIKPNEDFKEALFRVYAKLGEKLINQAKFDLNFSGSTCVGCYLNHNKLYCCNVGDSRAVVGKFNGGKWVAEALSNDHKTTDEVEQQRILKAGGHIEPVKDYQNNPVGVPRVWLKGHNYPGLAMTRSFGDLIAAGVGVINIPDIKEYVLSKQDKIIVVGSDGVWQFLSNQNVIDLVSPYYEKKQFQGACNRVLQFTLNIWNNQHPETIDDISFIVAFLDYDVENE